MPEDHELKPGAVAPDRHVYEELNVLGVPSGLRVHLLQGERLPTGPRGFTWRKVRPRPPGPNEGKPAS
jgi:hypothetical protein